MAPRINSNTTGTLPVIRQPDRLSFTPQRGWAITEVWRGTKAAIYAYASGFGGGAWTVDIFSSNGVVYEMHATASYDNTDPNSDTNVINDWSYLPGKTTKAIMHADNAFMNSIPQDEKEEIQIAINFNAKTLPKQTAGGETYDKNGNKITRTPHDFSANGRQLFAFMLSGQTDVLVFAPVIKHTMTVSNLYSLEVATANVGKVLTTAQLRAFENIPASILVDLPNDFYNGTVNLAYGWYKSPPEKKQSAYNKITIEREWQYGLYSPLVYTFA